MRYLLVSAAAVMAITGAAAIGNAQMQDDKGKGGPAAEGKAPGAGEAQRAPGASDKSEPGKGADKGQRDKDQKATDKGQRDKDQKATDKGQRDKATDKGQRDKDQQKADKADKGQRDKDQQKADKGQRDKDQQKAADQRQRDKDQQKADKGQRDKDQQKADKADKGQRDKDQQKADRDQRDTDKKAAERPDQKKVQVSEEKRSGVRDRLTKERRVDRVDRTRINVSINVGARLPRSVRLHTLPVTVVSFAPAYRGYSYIVLEDETICIVDPQTYVIVDVIPAGSQRADRPGRAQLTLSQEDMRFIYRTVPKSRTADVRVRLALGAEVPREVELLEFPPEIVERVPDVRSYRYIVAENDVVIVDPRGHEVALVINE
jgi:Protein of unknown function (DUF1236)